MFERRIPSARFAVIPNGVDIATLQPTPSFHRQIVFMGSHEWFPNRDAMEYFCAAILPEIRARLGAVEVTWIGFAPQPVQEEYAMRYGVQLTGYVDDIRPYMQRAACFIVPLRVGGGTRIKILDAWAMGKAVVSTAIGCEGLDAIDGVNIAIRDAPRSFAQAVCEILEDPNLRQQLERGARRTAENLYDWNMIGGAMMREYRAVMAQSPV